MYKQWKVALIAACFAMMVPSAITTEKPPEVKDDIMNLQTEEKKAYSHILMVQDNKGAVIEMEIEDYLEAVLLCEMPASFSLEALKAQAIVARTYALRQAKLGKKHDAADVCVNASCCQGFKSSDEYLADGGLEINVEKVRTAVYSTRDVVLMYDGELIDATYFSCSGGTTEAAVAVWGTDIPYLQSVVSPGEESAKHYTDEYRFTAEEFAEKLGLSSEKAPSAWVERIVFTEGGGVNELHLCGKVFEGTQVRKILDLRSTAFTVVWDGSVFVITTRGYGHRVGMSQYGAEAMANNGTGYEEILTHYYKGVKLSQFNWDD